jgi:gliding motility-associated-like protein
VSDKPRAAFSFSPDPPQENTPVVFTNNSIGAVRYVWFFGDGESITMQTLGSVSHIYNETNTFSAILVAINISGCTDTATKVIQSKISPLLDVPNAFTPNNDGINDWVTVRGFGITKMDWKIYNRWGVLVFQTNDRTRGWDGRYKGTVQPAEVYHYVLDVEYSDNTRYQKRGDITLLR